MLGGLVGFRNVERSDTGFFHFLCPMPENVEELDIDVLPQLPNEPKSYFWRLENWGCRHDISIGFEQIGDSELRSVFPIDYSPPVAALRHGAWSHRFRFRLLYCEPGNGFCGIATESDNVEYELTLDRPPTEDGIPSELIDDFSLYDRYEECQQTAGESDSDAGFIHSGIDYLQMPLADERLMSDLPNCPQCDGEFTYADGPLLICPTCAHEWSPTDVAATAADNATRDANGNVLENGDTVVVIKDLKFKGGVVKGGTTVKKIRIVGGDHDIDCKIDGIGAMALKSEFVKKA